MRRKGVATALITSLEEKLKIRGVTEIKVLTGSRNDRAIRMYERCNYVRDGELLLAKKMDN
ncbi:putative acetyltransferase [compost metagenome]